VIFFFASEAGLRLGWRPEGSVTGALNLPRSGRDEVTDALHFEGSLYQYGELAKQRFDLRIAWAARLCIDLRNLDRLIDSKTKPVAFVGRFSC